MKDVAMRIPPNEEEIRTVLDRRNGCSITVAADYITIHWDRPLPDEPHKPTRVEVITAGALLGIARALTGKGEEAVMKAMVSADLKRRSR